MIEIYTDGASSGNPGKGGYGAILVSREHQLEKEISEGFRNTTNNRMELLAVIRALELLKKDGLTIHIYTDSQYVSNSISLGWAKSWLKNNFKGKKNADLWKKYLALERKHTITVHWVKGHAGHVYNERCDVLATEAAKGDNLKIDEVYERESSSEDLFG